MTEHTLLRLRDAAQAPDPVVAAVIKAFRALRRFCSQRVSRLLAATKPATKRLSGSHAWNARARRADKRASGASSNGAPASSTERESGSRRGIRSAQTHGHSIGDLQGCL